jgi:hypothetical protein
VFSLLRLTTSKIEIENNGTKIIKKSSLEGCTKLKEQIGEAILVESQ